MKTPVLAFLPTACLAVSLALAKPPAPSPDEPAGATPPAAPPGGGHMAAPRSAAGPDFSGDYTLAGASRKHAKGKAYTANKPNESAVVVSHGAKLSLVDPIIVSTGDTSDEEASGIQGLNAAVLATSGGAIDIRGGSITSSGRGANTVFAHGKGSSITLAKTKITASGAAAHGLMAATEGSITATDLDVATSGVRSAPIATGRGGGTVTVKGGRYHSSGTTSPAIYSTGDITVSDADLVAVASEAAVVEGGNSVNLVNCSLSGARKRGVLIYQSASGDADEGRGEFSMSGGSLSAAEGPLFHVTNTTGVITLSGVTLQAPSRRILLAAAGEWGRSGANGGRASLIADAQTLDGDIAADTDSTVSLTLKNQSSLNGALQSVSLAMDNTSRWTVTGDSALVTLAATQGDGVAILSRIRSYGYTVTYDSTRAENQWLAGRTLPLTGGGRLVPAEK